MNLKNEFKRQKRTAVYAISMRFNNNKSSHVKIVTVYYHSFTKSVQPPARCRFSSGCLLQFIYFALVAGLSYVGHFPFPPFIELNISNYHIPFAENNYCHPVEIRRSKIISDFVVYILYRLWMQSSS